MSNTLTRCPIIVGSTISVSFENAPAVQDTWQAFQTEDLQGLIQTVYVNDDVCKSLGAKDIQLGLRMFREECDACVREIENDQVKAITLDDKRKFIFEINILYAIRPALRTIYLI